MASISRNSGNVRLKNPFSYKSQSENDVDKMENEGALSNSILNMQNRKLPGKRRFLWYSRHRKGQRVRPLTLKDSTSQFPAPERMQNR